MSGSPPGAKLTNQGVFQWRPQSAVKENFYFKATDECNASSTFEMSVEILTCPCTDKGVCRPDPNHPRGSGMYYCECQPGYEGQRCEREIDECLSNPCVHGRFKLSACYSIPLKFQVLFRCPRLLNRGVRLIKVSFKASKGNKFGQFGGYCLCLLCPLNAGFTVNK